MNKAQTTNWHIRLNKLVKSHRRAIAEAIEPRILMSTDTWTGAAGSNLWNAPGNWQANAVPAAGDSVVFPAYSGGGQTSIDLANNVTVDNITLNGNYQLINDTITVDGNLTTGASVATIQSNLVLNNNTTVTAGSGDAIVLYTIGDAGNHYGITEQGGGTVILHQADTYTGATVVAAGTLQLQATIDSNITVDSAGTLDAISSFTAPQITTQSGATLVLESTADVTLSGEVDLGSGTILNDRISSTSNGEVIAGGDSVELSGLSLSIQTVSYTPTIGQVFTVIANQTGSPVSGTFSGLAQGDITDVSGVYYQISYCGGQSGRDVTLTVVPQPAVWTDGNADGNWNEAGNWQGNAVPSASQSVEFPNLGSTDGTINLSGNVQVGTMTFDGSGYTISGNHTITLEGNIAANNNVLVYSNLLLGQNTTVYVAATTGSSYLFDVTGSVSDGGLAYGLTETGPGALAFQGSVTYTGVTTVDQGYFETQHNMAAGVVVNADGEFTAASVNVPGITSNGGTVSLTWQGNPSDITSTGNVALSGGMLLSPIESNGSGGYTTGELTATGSSINLGSAQLQIESYSYTPALGAVITLISNQTGSAVTGTFSGLPQGAVADFSGSYYQVSYTGGSSHHDVTLTVVAQPVAHALSIAQQPSSAPAGQALGTLVVDVLDQYGNVLTSDHSSVQIAAYNSTNFQAASLSGTTSVNASAGVATFSNLRQDTAGSYILVISGSDGLPVASTNTLTVSPAAATQLAFVQQPANAIAGQTMAPIEVAVEDQYGNLVTSNVSGVVVQNFPNVLNGNISASVVNGIATFSGLYVTQAGTYTINASDSSLIAANSSSFTVTPAAATQLGFVQLPANTVAGRTMAPIKVAVEDQYGNVVTNNASGVVVQTVPNVLLGTLSASVINGIATFDDVHLTQAGSYTINASDAGLTAANSSSFTVTPAAAAKLVVTQQPSSATAGQPIGNIAVDVEDTYGNVVTGNQSDVTIAATSTGVAMPASVLTGTTTVPAQDGAAVFNHLAISLGGGYTFQITDAALPAVVTNPITISNMASHIVTAGHSLPPTAITPSSAFGQSIAHAKSLAVEIENESTGAVAMEKNIRVSHGKATIGNLKTQKSGNYVMLISDSNGHTLTQTYTVQPATASRLVFAAQPEFTDGTATVSVEVVDAYGNQSTSADGKTVTLNLASHSSRHPQLTGTTTATVVNGLAVFANVEIDPGDHARLAARAKQLRPVVSNIFST